MKANTFILSAAIGASAIVCSATNPVHQILEDGKSWTWEIIDPHDTGEDMAVYNVTVCGDTIVDNIDCRRLCKSFVNRDYRDSYIAAYEEEGKLYVFSEGEKNFIEILNLNLHTGDPVIDWSVVREDAVDVDGVTCRRLFIGDAGNEIAVWVERVGSNIDMWMSLVDKPIGVYMRMVECQLNGKTIFTQNDFHGTTTGTIQVTNENVTDNSVIYDLSGRQIESPTPGSIYISGGKLIVR